MKTLIDDTIIVNLKPEIIKDDTENIMGANFRWGIFVKPEIISNDAEGLKVFCPTNNSTHHSSIRDVQAMRLFCLHIVRQMLEKKEQVDQEVYSKINFEVSEDIKNSMNKILSDLEVRILDEIFYLNNPIRPTKKEIKKISL